MAADALHRAQHFLRIARGLDRLAQDHIVEGVVRVVREVGVGIALNDRQPARHAGVHAFLAQFDAAPVDVFLACQ